LLDVGKQHLPVWRMPCLCKGAYGISKLRAKLKFIQLLLNQKQVVLN